MNFEGHFDNIVALLKPYQGMWYEEILNFYPTTLKHFPNDWVDQLDKLSDEEIWKIDGKKDISSLPNGELKDLIVEIQNLIILPKIAREEIEFPSWALINVKGKKTHEIKSIFPKIRELNNKYQFSHAVDIGGGVGHLARILSHYGDLSCISLDQNKEFQAKGKLRAKKYPIPEEAKDLEFINMTFGRKEHSSNDQKLLESTFSPKAFSIGLHTCGPLAVKHIETNLDCNTSGLLNFGCCYAKMDPEKDINISSYAKKNPLLMTDHTLTLATRGHTEMSYDEFLLKRRVKTWRYTLHLLLYHKLNIKEFVSAGEAPVSTYWGDFSGYAKNRLSYLNIDCPLTDGELESFSNDNEIKDLVHWMFLANIIRWQFGRVIEHYILTDRCLFLQENNHQVEMMEYFDEVISPRNIGILAIKK